MFETRNSSSSLTSSSSSAPSISASPILQPRLRTSHRHMPFAATALIDIRGRITFCSRVFGQLFHVDPASLEGRTIAELLPALPLRVKTPGFNLAFATYWANQIEPLKIPLRTWHGSLNAEITLRPLKVRNHSHILVFIRPSAGSIDAAFERFTLSAMARSEAIMVTNTDGLILYVNPAFERITGYSTDEAVGQYASLLRSGQHHNDFYQRLWSSLRSGEEVRAVFINRNKDGHLFEEDKHIRPFVDDNGHISHFVATSQCLSDPLKTAMLKLQHEAYFDPLTRLANRMLFSDRLRQAIARAARHNERCAVVFIDLDRFKHINDSFGHSTGDQVLLKAAECLRSAVRNEDTVARFGGDEFALILHTVDRRSSIKRICRQIQKAMQKPVGKLVASHDLQASFGVSLYPDDGDDFETLLRHADEAMYKAKAAGGDQIAFHCDKV